MRIGWLIVVLGVFPALVHAEDMVCGNAARPQYGNSVGVTRYLPSIDPSHVADGTCTQISKANTPSQRALLQSQTPPGSVKYLKVVGGLAEDMSQPEKDAVDAAITAAAAPRQALVDELASNAACSLSNLQAVITYLDNRHATIANQIQTLHDATATQINAIATANLAALKAGLNGLNDQDKTIADGVNGELTAVQKVIAQCLFALLKLTGR